MSLTPFPIGFPPADWNKGEACRPPPAVGPPLFLRKVVTPFRFSEQMRLRRGMNLSPIAEDFAKRAAEKRRSPRARMDRAAWRKEVGTRPSSQRAGRRRH